MTGRRYDPELPFGGLGSECGNLSLQRRLAELHAEDSRNLPAVDVSFPELADCRECDMCGGCETHEGCATDWNHITWLMGFASPGEPVCGAQGGPADRTNHVCALPPHHNWHHMDRRGNGWAQN
jgi:hypothetical protein